MRPVRTRFLEEGVRDTDEDPRLGSSLVHQQSVILVVDREIRPNIRGKRNLCRSRGCQ